MNNRLALLIDAENTNCSELDFILHKASSYGETIIRRMYGDFTRQNLACWQEPIQKHAFTVAQKFAYKKGKNSTDIELIMDAIELKLLNKVDGIILVAGDSDYTGLALKCREANMAFIGIGKRDSADVLKRSCQEFIEFPEPSNVFPDEKVAHDSKFRIEAPKLPGVKVIGRINYHLEDLETKYLKWIQLAIKQGIESDGYASLSKVIEALRKSHLDFDIKKVGSSTLSKFLSKHHNHFHIIYRNNNSSIYIKIK
jgi:uncharacterized LabA/DUF88 family protein